MGTNDPFGLNCMARQLACCDPMITGPGSELRAPRALGRHAPGVLSHALSLTSISACFSSTD